MSTPDLIRRLVEALWPDLDTEDKREEALKMALADAPHLRAGLAIEGEPRQVTLHIVNALFQDHGKPGRVALAALLDYVALTAAGHERQPMLEALRAEVQAFTPGPVVEDPDRATEALPDALARLAAALAEPQGSASVSPATVESVANHRPSTLTEYHLTRIAAWSRPRYAVDHRFVQLTLLIDKGEEGGGQRWAEAQRFDALGDVLEVESAPLVLVGGPGCGKSTLLRRLELDMAAAALRTPEDAPITFFAPLGRYRPEADGEAWPAPRDWLARQWARRYPKLPALDRLLEEGRVLLLDALNEIPHANREAYVERAGRWRDLLFDLEENAPGSRTVFTCRTVDYGGYLSGSELKVPQVRVERLEPERVRDFIAVHSSCAAALWARLEGSAQLELFRAPLYLKMLVDQAGDSADLPAGRAALFASFVREAARQELDKGNALLGDATLVAPREQDRLRTTRDWRPGWALPEGELCAALAALAYRMQEARGQAAEGGQVSLRYAEATSSLGAARADDSRDGGGRAKQDARADDLLAGGAALGALEHDPVTGEVQFVHQLLQEFFAATVLTRAPVPALARSEWRAEAMSPGLAETVAGLHDYEPLPPAPATGWEETFLFAAEMTREPPGFVESLALESARPFGSTSGPPA